MTQALQALQRPDEAIAEILRVGRTGIVTFQNFGHWRVRLALLGGRMPVTPSLPSRWFDTPNIHLCTVEDLDRKSFVQGKSVAVRVDLGGRRSIKKKHKQI